MIKMKINFSDAELREILYQLRTLDNMHVSADYDRQKLIEKLESYFDLTLDYSDDD